MYHADLMPPQLTTKDRSTSSPPARWMLGALRLSRPVVKALTIRALVGRNRSRGDDTAGRFTRAEAIALVDATFTRFEPRVPELPSEPTLGSRQNVMLAALTLSFLEALEGAGIERGYAVELTADVCWRVYRRWGQATRLGTRMITRSPVRRLRLSVDAFLTFPFGRPGYRFDDVPEPEGRSLDMVRCPVADYLGARDAVDLCASSWCNLDYPLAEMWGARLERSGTLVKGADCCDFRFRVEPSAQGVERPATGSRAGESIPAGGAASGREAHGVQGTEFREQ